MKKDEPDGFKDDIKYSEVMWIHFHVVPLYDASYDCKHEQVGRL